MTGDRSEGGDGLLLVDKPSAWTSHDVVARVRRLAGTRRVGHAGTLDPMATGLLVLGVGKATRLLTYAVGCDKTYTATVRLGQSTLTDDADGPVTAAGDVAAVTDAGLAAAAAQWTGRIEQVPCAVSAIKVGGRRAYAETRAGREVDLSPRAVTVYELRLGRPRVVQVDEPGQPGSSHTVLDLELTARVSSGTYIRALARDLGRTLGTGGHLTALRRHRVGGFDVEQAHELADLEAIRGRDEPLPLLPPVLAAQALLPVGRLTAAEAEAVRHGRSLPAPSTGDGPWAAIDEEGELIAVVESLPSGRARPRVVFAAKGA